jgi:uncharacterized protein YdiU (UPF0061 family)
MDYGPFGFMERYTPHWNMWIGGGQHFSFQNQPIAGEKNLRSLAKALMPLLDGAHLDAAKEVAESHAGRAVNAMLDVWARKLGLEAYDEATHSLHTDLEATMKQCPCDFTIFWRQLAGLPELALADPAAVTDQDLVAVVRPAFYESAGADSDAVWSGWLRRWLSTMQAQHGHVSADHAALISSKMKRESPKYVPREWMLAHAYEQAYAGDTSGVHQLHQLFLHPYDEQDEFEELYYRKATEENLRRGGVAFMS